MGDWSKPLTLSLAKMLTFDVTTCLSAELELVADFDLGPLRDHLQEQTGIVRDSVEDGTHSLWLALNPTEKDLDEAVRRYASIIGALPPPLRLLWDTCSDRCLNTGIQSGRTPHALRIRISEAALAEAARISLRLEFSVYAIDLEDRSVPGRPDPHPG